MLRRIAVLVLLLGILPAVSHALPRALPLELGPDAPAAVRAAEGWLAHLGRLLGGAFERGRPAEAEAAFREVHEQFLDLKMDINAALVALDLAVLLSEQGRTHELKALALDLLAAFEAREIHRESTAVLILFHRACEEERLTADLARQLGSLLRKGRG